MEASYRRPLGSRSSQESLSKLGVRSTGRSLAECSSNSSSSVTGCTPNSSCCTTPDAAQLEPYCWSCSRDWSIGCHMIKVTSKKIQSRLFTFDDRLGHMMWESRKWGSRKLAVEDIKELRYKERGRAYREQRGLGAENEELWVTIIYNIGAKLKALHIIATDREDFTAFSAHLENMRNYRRAMIAELSSPYFSSSAWVDSAWSRLATLKTHISADSLLDSVRSLGINVSRKYFMASLKALNATDIDELGYKQLIKHILRRSDVLFAAKNILDGATSISRKDGAWRLQILQGDDLELDSAFLGETDELDACALANLIATSPCFDHVSPKTEDMTHPLWDYFISSSHNTYLLGSQFSGESTVEGYIRALELGCRSVELDCYDGPDGKAVIRHGNSLTTAVSFETVVKTIAQYAFVASPYPLILSLEIHASLTQQDQMAMCLRSCLGALLLDHPLPQSANPIPSPQDLIYRILIKGRDKSKTSQPRPGSAPDLEILTDSDTVDSTTSESEFSPSTAPSQSYGTDATYPLVVSTARLSASLAQLMVYTVGCKYRGFNKKEVYNANQMISMSERTCAKILKTSERDAIKHTRNHLTRVYPSAYRVTSRNFNPQTFWQAGIQLAALNWQTWDLGLQMNSALFERQTDSGYVLKAPHLITKLADMRQESTIAFHTASLDLISAFLPTRSRAHDDPSTLKVEVALHTQNGSEIKMRSKAATCEGLYFIWNESFEFKWQSRDLQLVFLRLEVFEDDHLISSCCLSLKNLLPGYRHLPLKDTIGETMLGSFLFVKSKIRFRHHEVAR